VVNEGEEAALFVVLAGCMEVTKLIDGIERTVGKRAPGKIFGEVPLIYGTPFQSNCRRRNRPGCCASLHASTTPPPRLRLSWRKPSARSPVSGSAGCKASRRAASAQVTMLGHRWDTVCLDLRRFLARNQITSTG